jgi:hypothetical protein
MTHSNFFGSVSTSSGSSFSSSSLLFAGAFLPGPPFAHGESLALKSVPEAELMERAKRRMSSV